MLIKRAQNNRINGMMIAFKIFKMLPIGFLVSVVIDFVRNLLGIRTFAVNYNPSFEHFLNDMFNNTGSFVIGHLMVGIIISVTLLYIPNNRRN